MEVLFGGEFGNDVSKIDEVMNAGMGRRWSGPWLKWKRDLNVGRISSRGRDLGVERRFEWLVVSRACGPRYE
jgi:hypothetical protein